MPKIEQIRVRIETGLQPADQPVRIKFNGFEIPLTPVSGGVAPNQTFEGEFGLRSMGHSCVLLGPKASPWEIRSLHVRYEYGPAQAPAAWDFGARTLKPGEEWNILEQPAPTFDV